MACPFLILIYLKNNFQGSGGFCRGGGVTTYTISFTNGHILITWKNPAENCLELSDVMLNIRCRKSVKGLGDAIQDD